MIQQEYPKNYLIKKKSILSNDVIIIDVTPLSLAKFKKVGAAIMIKKLI